eukprot:CAMPEP_0117000704 /NCGR_PEP_ID=MMETSP0472-20121206/2956_1 /TAXON_ID=693140 ORGANISM="Tiarina fusus, Strain LIS" /NCGR_SAMPLE_ID=MMETSP0472 /ASSEMBLY_ACC=CAM_ASM_000603 /LENGTH=403 /DNA_ID=CAMNT_0004700483 /DNA_START=244 /DNA_END=1455 /DNA_ORIENTATION=-
MFRGPQQHRSIKRFVFDKRVPVPKGGGAGLAANTVPLKPVRQSRFARLAWYAKMARIPFLITAIYGLGYRQGIMDAARNPLKLQQGTFESLCMDMGVRDGHDVEIVSERTHAPTKLRKLGSLYGENSNENIKHSVRAQKVADIGREIIRAARRYVRGELHDAMGKARAKLGDVSGISDKDLMKKLNEDEDVEFWLNSLERIEGFTKDGIQDWQYILVGTPVPNAFVTEVLPQRFFVTTGLFDEFIENDDELALVLGHEISHLIMGHLSTGNTIELFLRGLEILVLMLDPTEGLLSLGIVGFLASSRDALVAMHSRSNEHEADELGCKLAAMACYDTTRGSEVFRKMHELDEKMGSSGNDLMSSHPPSKERYETLKERSKSENMTKHSHCHQLKGRVRRALTRD